jgi:hypothetical protein
LVVRSGETCPSSLLQGDGGAAVEGGGEAAKREPTQREDMLDEELVQPHLELE